MTAWTDAQFFVSVNIETMDESQFTIATRLLKLTLFTVLVPGTVTLWVPAFLLLPRIHHRKFSTSLGGVLALLFVAVGASGYFWCALDFAFKGEGTPAPIDPPKHLVAKGLYKYSRNPMYESVLMILIGENLLFESGLLLGYAAAVALGFHAFVVFYEERTLQRKMGAAYLQYCREVPRWGLRVRRAREKDAI
jgi:protein-S-isoprenylcysteine O-methyltransferase Ste14